MKILLIGDAKELYVINLARHLKEARPGLEISVLDTNPLKIQPQDERASLFEKIYSYERPFPGFLGKIIGRGRRRLLEPIIQKQNFDWYIAIGLWIPTCEWLEKITSPRDRILGVLVGTDYFRKSSRPDLPRFKRILARARILAASNPAILDGLAAENIDPSKFRQIQFGLAPMEALAALNDLSRDEAKKRQGIDPATLTICCGYNASENQQHIGLIRAIRESKNLPENHLLLLPLTYGGDENYKSAIKEELVRSGLRYRIFEEYLDKNSMALLWKSVDIFIQMQRTDCLSGSMMENLYCGNLVITGDWLPYQVLKDRGVRFFEAAAVPGLSEQLDLLTPQRAALEVFLRENKTKFEGSFWKNIIGSWVGLIEQPDSQQS